MSDQGSLLLAILGPTAVGKTAVGIFVAEALAGEIVSVDSRQVYREMDIGTAKPTPDEQSRVAHHVIDCVRPDEPFSASNFQHRADVAISDIRSRGKAAILVGGAGLYFRALMDGLFEGPSADAEIRARLNAEADEQGSEHLHQRLTELDPEAAARIHRNDRMRIVRALEVYELTGTPISELRSQWDGEPRYRCVAVGLRRPRPELNHRANERVRQMVAGGLVDEVRALRERYPRGLRAFQGFGYRELWDSLDGRITHDKAVELLKRNTHQYAKRQLTWFRSDRRIRWLDLGEHEAPTDTADRVLALHREALSTLT
ncbi:tRNA (adenosine(37)-N6)-dimethylallyltransferase MiaA [Candidatus Poribacteria bacterium]|nr:tRNA (adenosine(37)-N6)-dimethylallyltransferase MiaA [Candidatus Poribacteria bacterium]